MRAEEGLELPDDQGRLHPSVELVLVGCGLVVVYGVASPLVPVALLATAAVSAMVSRRVSWSRWLTVLVVLAGPMLVMVGLIQGLFYPGEGSALWEVGPAAVTAEGLAVAAQLWLRVAAMIGLCALFAMGSDSSRVFDAMIGLRMPLQVAYVCATALNLMPMLRTHVAETLTARAARGWQTHRLGVRLRLLPGVLASLVTTSLVQLEQRQDVLTQRGFGWVPRPTPARHYPSGRMQTALLVLMPIISLAVVVASVSGFLPLPTAGDLLSVLGDTSHG